MSQQPPVTKATPLNQAVADVVETVSQGQPPANVQVTRVLDETQNLLEAKKREAPLSDTGKDIANKMENVVQAARDTILEKNAGEELQRMVQASKAASKEISTSEQAAGIQDTMLEAKDRAAYIAAKQGLKTTQDVAKLGNAFLQLGYELATSIELRRLLIDLLDLIQEGLQGAQEKVESAKSELESGKPPKELAKDSVDAAAEASKKVIDVSSEATQKLGELKDTAKQVVSGERPASDLVPMSEEQKEKFRQRFDALLDRLSTNEAYNNITRQLFATFDQLRDVFDQTADKLKEETKQAGEQIKQSSAVNEAYESAVTFFKRFVPAAQFDRLMDDLRELFRVVRNDPELTLWWLDLKAYIRYALDHPREVVTPERNRELTSLIDRAFDKTMNLRYHTLTRKVNREARAVVEGMREDLMQSRLVQSLRELATTLFINKRTGKIEYKEAEMREFRRLMASLILEEVKFIPLQKMTGSTDEYDFSLSQMYIYLYDILPEHISIDWRAHADIDLKDIDAHARTSLSIRATNMRAHIRNACFWFRRKKGLIKIEDHGIADISIGGSGASFRVDLIADSDNRGFEVHRVVVDMSSLSVHLVEAQHKFLLNLVKPFWESNVRRSVEREIEIRLRTLLTRVFKNLSKLSEQVADAAKLEDVKQITRETISDVQAAKQNLSKDDKAATLSH